MYTCGKCKKQFADSPSITNACGSFCVSCKKEMYEKSVESNRQRKTESSGCCVWCGEKLTTEIMHASHKDDSVCKTCESRRDWLLKAIRLSYHPARYVARTEERERPLREERERFMQANAKPVAITLPESEARLLRLEGMLDKLTKALGV